LGWVGPQSEGKAANKCSAYVGENAFQVKLDERMQSVITCLQGKGWLFCTICRTLFWLLHDSIGVI
jgi:hypothetical protein